MRGLLLTSLTGPEALELVDDLPEPQTAEGMVIVDVQAAGASFPDLLLCRGEYQLRPEPPFVPGIEVAGTVRSAPAQSGLAPGDRVAAATMLGGWAEVAAAPAALTFGIPDNVGFEAAAGLVMNHHTALFALERRGRIQAGETVLVHGAGGGVGTAAVQVARALGGRVLAVASPGDKAAAAATAGAEVVLDPRSDWLAAVREATGGRGADVIVDPVGGDRFDQSLRCLAPEGRLLVIGFAEGRIPTVAVNRVLLRNADIVGVNWGGFVGGNADYALATGKRISGWLADGSLRPVVGATYPLHEGRQAMRDLAARTVAGKAVLTVR